MTVYFFIVNYFSDSETLDLVAQIRRLQKGNVTNVVVAVFNNGSNGVSIRESPLIDCYMEDDNIGLAPAWIALERICDSRAGDVLVFLNNDVVVPGDLLLKIDQYKRLLRHSICGPVIHDLDGNCWSAGGRFEFGGVRVIHHSSAHSEVPISTGHVSGCFMIMCKEIYDKVGGFDARFFFRGEEWDFNFRAKKQAVPRYLIPSIIVVHKVNGSHNPESVNGVIQKIVAKKLYWKKHFPKVYFPLYYLLLIKTLFSPIFSSKTICDIRLIFRGL